MKNLFLLMFFIATCMTLANASTKKILKSDSKQLLTESNKSESQSIKLNGEQKQLLLKYQMAKDNSKLHELKQATLKMAQKSVPVLVTVLKSREFSDESRWLAMFMLGRTIGRKSAPYISKYTDHPNWMLRVAAYKTLVALDQKQLKNVFGKGLKDSSMLVKLEALDSIAKLKIKELAPLVWKMVYDESNYIVSAGKRKRTDVVKRAIRTLGELEYRESQRPLLKMIKNRNFDDMFEDLDYTLSKLAHTNSPRGSIDVKRAFWQKQTTI